MEMVAELAEDLPLLVVDDEEQVRRILSRVLERNGFTCRVASDVSEARALLANEEFALVLSDVNMPGQSGIDLIKTVVNEHPDTATVMCTGVDDTAIANTALELGAYGYVVKPFEPNEILIAVMNALRRRRLEIENRNHRDHLEQMVKDRTGDLWAAISDLERAQKETRLSREETVQRLSMAAEFRDHETASHIKRMSLYCALLGEKLGEDSQRCETIRLSSVMHDVGKIGIPDSILLKPSALDAEEWKIMKTHAEIGYRILSNSRSHLLAEAAEIALTHHERIDGSGYPRGLVEDEIPLVGKIAAVADVFDALTTNRVYRKAFALGEAVDIMKEGRGEKFDPEILDIFLGSLDRVLGIKEMHRDDPGLMAG